MGYIHEFALLIYTKTDGTSIVIISRNEKGCRDGKLVLVTMPCYYNLKGIDSILFTAKIILSCCVVGCSPIYKFLPTIRSYYSSPYIYIIYGFDNFNG